MKEAANGGGLRHHRDIARRAMEIGGVQGGHDLEAIRNAVNRCYVGIVALRQAGRPRLAARRAP
jgi:hypothetical protein